MEHITAAAAVAAARLELGIAGHTPGQAYPVRMLEPPRGVYYLVLLSGAVAAVDAATGAVQLSARAAGCTAVLAVSEAQARAIAKSGPGARAELVWKPCRASLSPLYPIWEISAEDRRAYVDQQGTLWTTLEPKRPGG